MHNDNRSGLVPPEIPTVANFELKGNILATFKDIPFYGNDPEDYCKNIYDLLDIVN